MKSKIFLYLFVFALLYIVFQYMNARKADAYFTTKVEFLEERVDSLEAENHRLFNKNYDLGYFSLTQNDLASEYFMEKGINPDELNLMIKDSIIGLNGTEDNPLVPFPGMMGVMRINHIHVLNNKWIIADFTDGTYWGEVLLEYFVEEDETLSFEVLDGALYGRRD